MLSLLILYNSDLKIFSPTVAIETTLQTIENDSFLAIAVDTPFIDIESISQLIEAHKKFQKEITVVSVNNELQPLFCIYSKKILPKLSQMIKNDMHKLNFLIKESDFHEEILNKCKIVINLNYYTDYQKALSL